MNYEDCSSCYQKDIQKCDKCAEGKKIAYKPKIMVEDFPEIKLNEIKLKNIHFPVLTGTVVAIKNYKLMKDKQ